MPYELETPIQQAEGFQEEQRPLANLYTQDQRQAQAPAQGFQSQPSPPPQMTPPDWSVNDDMALARSNQEIAGFDQAVNEGSLDPREPEVAEGMANARQRQAGLKRRQGQAMQAKQKATMQEAMQQAAQQEVIANVGKQHRAQNFRQGVVDYHDPVSGETVHMYEKKPNEWEEMEFKKENAERDRRAQRSQGAGGDFGPPIPLPTIVDAAGRDITPAPAGTPEPLEWRAQPPSAAEYRVWADQKLGRAPNPRLQAQAEADRQYREQQNAQPSGHGGMTVGQTRALYDRISKSIPPPQTQGVPPAVAQNRMKEWRHTIDSTFHGELTRIRQREEDEAKERRITHRISEQEAQKQRQGDAFTKHDELKNIHNHYSVVAKERADWLTNEKTAKQPLPEHLKDDEAMYGEAKKRHQRDMEHMFPEKYPPKPAATAPAAPAAPERSGTFLSGMIPSMFGRGGWLGSGDQEAQKPAPPSPAIKSQAWADELRNEMKKRKAE